MKNLFTLLIAVCCILIFSTNLIAQNTNNQREWWSVQYTASKPFVSSNARKLSLLKVQGNKFVNAENKTILLKGVSIADPDKLEYQGQWKKELFTTIQQWGANVIRIPVHPVAWRLRTPDSYVKLLDQAIEWCTELGMYVVIDWHSIGNLKAGLFQDPMYETSLEETFTFWKTISCRYTGNNTVAFYELFNEPTNYRGTLGKISWDEWKKINEDLIGLIRAYDNEVIPLVATFDWAYDLTPLLIAPVNAERIGYITHPYPNKRSQPWEPKWQENFGFAADTYPIIASEIGFTAPNFGDENYGRLIVDFCQSRGISWIAWAFDPDWGPQLINDWKYTPTPTGEFFKKEMLKK